MKAFLVLLVLGLTGAILYWSTGGNDAGAEPLPPVSQPAAESILEAAMESARSGQYEAVCLLGGRNTAEPGCLEDAAEFPVSGVEEVKVVGYRQTVVDERHWPGGVLELCIHSSGGSIYTEFYVVRAPGDRLDAPQPLFWQQRYFSEGNVAIADMSGGIGCDSRCEA